MTNEGQDIERTITDPEPLRLAVVDREDLAVISANLQDAEVMNADMAYLPRTKRFAMVVSRFDWTQASKGVFERCRSGLHFERVLKVAHSNLHKDEPDRIHQLLAISFTPENPPSGNVLLTFSGGGMIRLTVECLEAEIRDIGPRWTVETRPGHRLDDRNPSA